MNIVMFTNTFTPHVGGVAHSVASLSEMLREMGHAVLIVAPDYAEAARSESDILRVPAIQNFNGSDFSVPIPFTRSLEKTLNAFEPDIVHSHHPFLLGDTALRIAASRALPTIFTYHTRYELYGHYVAQDAPVLQRLVLSLAAGYCDLCEHIIAPTRSIADLLHHHDVTKPITIIPTGIDLARFAEGDRLRLRSRLGLAETDFIVGHVGRLAPEKNLTYLTEAVCLFLSQNELAHFVAAGDGASASEMRRMLDEAGLQDRCHLLGVVEGAELADAMPPWTSSPSRRVPKPKVLCLSRRWRPAFPSLGLMNLESARWYATERTAISCPPTHPQANSPRLSPESARSLRRAERHCKKKPDRLRPRMHDPRPRGRPSSSIRRLSQAMPVPELPALVRLRRRSKVSSRNGESSPTSPMPSRTR
ncbi:MAG: glycosyltransferase family 4 protein [Mesorhizobium sp.]|uniref:glycosyltransferase n=1 Tax=Mesorhizobium sp. TaxID=1871066 RepID=UPI0011F407FA|nr:MAG: glycosyltransferase family 4 protein [Mesorhizobium sp.]